jgi:hypothetical protein
MAAKKLWTWTRGSTSIKIAVKMYPQSSKEDDPMTRITLDAALREKLKHLTGALELCDEKGQVVARLYPVTEPSPWVAWEPEFNPEEWERRRQSAEWLTTEEAIAYLEKLGCFR